MGSAMAVRVVVAVLGLCLVAGIALFATDADGTVGQVLATELLENAQLGTPLTKKDWAQAKPARSRLMKTATGRTTKLGYWEGTGLNKPYYGDPYYGKRPPTPRPFFMKPVKPCEDLAADCDDMKSTCESKRSTRKVCEKTCGACPSPMEWVHFGWTQSLNATYPPFYFGKTIGELEKRKEMAEEYVVEAGKLSDPHRKGIPDPVLNHVAQIIQARPPKAPRAAGNNIDSAIQKMIQHQF